MSGIDSEDRESSHDAYLHSELTPTSRLNREGAPIDGITGTLKLVHAAESVRVDIELHGASLVHFDLISAIRNTNYYEFGWTHPEVPSYAVPVHADDYTEGFPAAVGMDSCVPVLTGPGLAVTYDWEYINRRETGTKVLGL